MVRRAVCAIASAVAVVTVTANGGPALRLHGTIEPIRSYSVFVPRLAGSGNNSLVITHLAPPGSHVKKGDLLVEFDSQAQVKTAHDREAEYRDFVEQINKMRADQAAARAHDDTAIRQAENAVKSAQIDVSTNDVKPRIDAEKNDLMLEEMRAHLVALQRTSDLRRKAEAADVHLLEIERDRAHNAWKHAERNATKMRIVTPLDGLVVLKTTWKNGSFGEVQEGEDTRPGVPIMDVVDPSAMRVRARVNQADVERLRVGQIARITLDSFPSREFNGRLDALSPIATTSALNAKLRVFLAVFSIAQADPHLLPDLAAAIDVEAVRPGPPQADR
jgi:multidrug resistance efflux pump